MKRSLIAGYMGGIKLYMIEGFYAKDGCGVLVRLAAQIKY